MADKKYYPSIDLIKFICAVGIVWIHKATITENFLHFPFANCSMLVELFYLMTGLYTYRHFYYQKENSEDIMHYCVKKYVRLLPYSCFSIIGCYLFVNFNTILEGNFHGAIYEARDLPLELLLLRSATMEATRFKTYCSILWFLSSMFIVLPLFCFVCTTLKKHALMISVLFCELWYVGTDAKRYGNDWQSLCRAMAGLMLGIIVFHIGKYIAENAKCGGGVFAFAEILTILFIVVTLYKNYYILKVYVVSFIVLMSIVFSQKGIQIKYNIKVTKFLGEISMIMYFAHPIAQKIVMVYLKDSPNNVLTYFILSLVFTALLYCLDKLIKNGRFIWKSRMCRKRS